jgi:hypothetical protein
MPCVKDAAGRDRRRLRLLGTITEESVEVKRLGRENAELKRAVLKAVSPFFAPNSTGQVGDVAFIREHQGRRVAAACDGVLSRSARC